ncbi:hypothetical protein E5D57_010534 [Metarhizium anisopliae]|nr:hypothetical protein E5D57_010534 [Metarhizium anisopliae]
MLGRSRKTLQLGLWDERRRLRVISSHLAGGRCTQQEMQGPQVLQSRVFVMTGTRKHDGKARLESDGGGTLSSTVW